MKPGDLCPTCGAPLCKKEGMFAYHDGARFPGMVCKPCNALWDFDGDTIYDYGRKYVARLQRNSNEPRRVF